MPSVIDHASPARPLEDSPVTNRGALGVVGRTHSRRGPVVLAVHGAEPSQAAVIAAHLIAERLGVPLRVITVVEPVPVFTDALSPFPLPVIPWEELAPTQEASVRKLLRDAMVPENEWTLETRRGQPARLIAAFANEVGAALVVVDAARRRGLRHSIAGMMALQILRHATCPVLSVAMGFSGLARRIVAGVDFSPASIHAIEEALAISDEHAHLTLVHVPVWPALPTPIRDERGSLYGVQVANAFAQVRTEVAPSAPEVSIDVKEMEAPVAPSIVAEAKSAGADLVCVGAHGLGLVDRLFVGSTTTAVLHLAHCSVLAAPLPSAAEFMRLELRMSDTATSDDRTQWAEILDAFAVRNAGRRSRLEIDDPDIGAQTQADGYELHGVTFDPTDRSIEIMLARGDGSRAHLSRRITDVDSISVRATEDGLDKVLRITGGRSQTLLLMD